MLLECEPTRGDSTHSDTSQETYASVLSATEKDKHAGTVIGDPVDAEILTNTGASATDDSNSKHQVAVA